MERSRRLHFAGNAKELPAGGDGGMMEEIDPGVGIAGIKLVTPSVLGRNDVRSTDAIAEENCSAGPLALQEIRSKI